MNLRDRLSAFRDHFKMAKIAEVDFSNLKDFEKRFLDEFYNIVIKWCDRALHETTSDFRIYGATRSQALGENFGRCRSLTFRIAEITENRLIGVNAVGGLSLNEICRHYDYERDCTNPFCFVWQVPIGQIESPAKVPTIESIRCKYELHNLNKMVEELVEEHPASRIAQESNPVNHVNPV